MLIKYKMTRYIIIIYRYKEWGSDRVHYLKHRYSFVTRQKLYFQTFSSLLFEIEICESLPLQESQCIFIEDIFNIQIEVIHIPSYDTLMHPLLNKVSMD